MTDGDEMLLRVALQTARDDYEDRRERQRQRIEIARREGRYTGRKADQTQHRRILALRKAGMSIAKTAELTPCSPAQVKRIMALHRAKVAAPVARERFGRDGSLHPRARVRRGDRADPKQVSPAPFNHRFIKSAMIR